MFIVRPDGVMEINTLDDLVVELVFELSREAKEMIDSFSKVDKAKLFNGIEQYNDVWLLHDLDDYICNLTEKQLNCMGIKV